MINIKRYSLIDRAKVLKFLNHWWKEMSENQRKELFQWRYENNPNAKDSHIYIALDNEMLIGLRTYVPLLYRVKDKMVNVFVPADTFVQPEYQRLGIFRSLNNAIINDIVNQNIKNAVVLSLTANQKSYLAHRKNGAIPTNGINAYMYNFSLYNFIRNLFKKNNICHLGNQVLKYTEGDRTLEISSNLDATVISAFIQENENFHKITAVRDEVYFKWRYSYDPGRYIFAYCWKQRKLTGYCILERLSGTQFDKLQAIFQLNEYKTVDPFLFSLMIKLMKTKLNITFIRTWGLNRTEERLLKSAGFIFEPKWLFDNIGKKRLPILVRPLNGGLSNPDYYINDVDIRNIENWKIHMADKH